METLTLDKETTNENFTSDKILTDSDIFGEKKIFKNLDTSSFNDFSVIILLVKNPAFKNNLRPFDIDIFGKKMWEWVALSLEGYPLKSIACSPESNVISLIKPHTTETKFTAVFFSDTPLLQKSTIEEIFMFCRSRDISALKLTRGYVFNTEYLKTIDEITSVQTEYFEEEDFLTAYNFKQLSIITDVIKNRILSFHMNNGVLIKDPGTTNIDADVVIETGTVIMPINSIFGRTYIGKNCIVGVGNTIENSILCDNVFCEHSVVRESRVSENQKIGPFDNLEKVSV